MKEVATTLNGQEGVLNVNMQENSRLIIGLREMGWTDTEINDLVLWVETGDEKYKPKKEKAGE